MSTAPAMEPRLGRGPGTSTGEQQLQVDEYFARTAAGWRELYERADVIGAVFQDRRLAALAMVDGLGLPTGAPVLEAGCGAGLLTVELARRGFEVEATDVNEAMLELTSRACAAAGFGDRVRVARADAHRTRYADGSFELIVALGVIPWLHSPEAALRELRRLLRPGGRLLATTDNRWRLNHLLDPRFNPGLRRLRPHRARGRFDPAMHTPQEFRALLSTAGFELERSQAVGFGPFAFWAHPLLPGRAGVRLHRGLQRLADLGLPGLRSTGSHLVALARRSERAA